MADMVEREAAAAQMASVVRNRLAAAATLACLMFEGEPKLPAYQRRLDVLARRTVGLSGSIPLADLVRDELSYAASPEQVRQCLRGGDERILSEAAASLAMAFSELAALAAGMEVWSGLGRGLEVTWRVFEHHAGSRELHMAWTFTAPAAHELALDRVTEQLMLRGPEIELRARVTMATHETGLTWSLALPAKFIEPPT